MAARALHWLRTPPRPGGVREVWRVATPIIISMMSFTLMQFVDRIFLAHHSSVALRAALPAGTLSFTLTSFFQGLAGFSGTGGTMSGLAGSPAGISGPAGCGTSPSRR